MMAHFVEYGYSGVILAGPTARQNISRDSSTTTQGEK
jgi:hypothetical protein